MTVARHVGGAMVGVDVGGTKVAAGLVDADGRIAATTTAPTRADEGPEQVLDVIAQVVREVAGSTDGAEGADVRGVGVGSAGVIEVATGRVLSATQAISGWKGTDIADGVRRRTGLAVTVDNDVNAHAAGEAWRGAGRDAATMLMLTVGTGVGGAIVVDGRPLHGRHGAAGEVGHMPARGAEHLRCACGRLGHIEAIASGPGMVAHFAALGGDAADLDARGLLTRAEGDDALARRAVTESAVALGTTLAGLVTTVDPDVVVLGGGLAAAGEVWWTPMEQAMRAEVVDVLRGVALRPAQLGPEAALVGAAHRAWVELGTVGAGTAGAEAGR